MTDIVWIVPEQRGGVGHYSTGLWPFVEKECQAAQLKILPPIHDIESSLAQIKDIKPKLIHVQHEYSLFGSKVPPLYFFPDWIKQVKETVPDTKIIATAHTVLGSDFNYPTQGRGWQVPLRFMANRFLMSYLLPIWVEKTWGPLDGVIVHSELQLDVIRKSGCPRGRAIPLFVQKESSPKRFYHPVFKSIPQQTPIILVFGFITPEKGQDVVIQAFARLQSPAHLILAGGARRRADRRYLKYCQGLIRQLGLKDRVGITGFLEPWQLDEFFARASIVVTPFKETYGSASITQALGRGCAILASDLPLNRELETREPGCLSFFRSQDPVDCAQQIERLLENRGLRDSLSLAAHRYAESHSPVRSAQKHVEFYREILGNLC